MAIPVLETVAHCMLLGKPAYGFGQGFIITSFRYNVEPNIAQSGLPSIDICVDRIRNSFAITEYIEGHVPTTTLHPSLISCIPPHYVCTSIFVALSGLVVSDTFSTLFSHSGNDDDEGVIPAVRIGLAQFPMTAVFSLRLSIAGNVFAYNEAGMFRRIEDAEFFTVEQTKREVQAAGPCLATLMLDLSGHTTLPVL